MSEQSAPTPDCQPPRPTASPFDEHAAASVRAYAADRRAKVDVLASVLEEIADNGYPAAESGVPWEEARDAHLEGLAGEQPRVA